MTPADLNTRYAAACAALHQRGRDPVYCVALIVHGDESLRRWFEAYHGVADEMRELDAVVGQMFALEHRLPVQMRLFEEATP